MSQLPAVAELTPSSGEHAWWPLHQQENHWPINSARKEYFAGLREDAMSRWKSFCMQHTYKAPLVHEGWSWCSPGIHPARPALEGHCCLPWLCQLANQMVTDVCLFAELFGTQKPNWHLQCANMGTSHTLQEVWGGWLMPQLSGLIQEPKLRVLTFTWQLLHLQSKFNTLLQEWRGIFCCVCFQKRWTPL